MLKQRFRDDVSNLRDGYSKRDHDILDEDDQPGTDGTDDGAEDVAADRPEYGVEHQAGGNDETNGARQDLVHEKVIDAVRKTSGGRRLEGGCHRRTKADG
ncbi:hypothetical protein DESC_920036 [Desulfosarcina cetonica]|nr:hypothetical protein DESC_920036 [Desulfosarcina cetonica]